MRGMVRVLVGTMLEVSSRRRSVAELRRACSTARRARRREKRAPAHGLYLESVAYS